MGNNAAFTSFEASVLACYNKGVLDKELLDQLAEPYRDSDIDRGGMVGNLSKDGLDVDGIVLKIYAVDFAKPPEDAPQEDFDSYYERMYDALQPIYEGWGWR